MSHPFLQSRFPVAWSSLKPELVEEDIGLVLERAEAAVAQIEGLALDEANYDNTLAALELAIRDLGRAWGLVTHLESVLDSEGIRQASKQMLPQVTAFFSGLALRSELWLRVQAVAKRGERLSQQQQRYLEETVADFREAGADLEDEVKDEVRSVDARLAELAKQFSENVLDSTNAYELVIEDEARLDGLPESARAAAAQAAELKEKKGWLFTLHVPSMLPVLQYAKDAELRRELWENAQQIGRSEQEGADNRPVLQEMLRLRQRKAELLGKENFVDLVTARRMAGSCASVQEFSTGLFARVKDAFAQDVRELGEFYTQQTGEDRARLMPWDDGFYAELMRRERYDFDEELLRPYFSMPRVMQGLFELCEDLFGVVVEQLPAAMRGEDGQLEEGAVEVWHEQVQAYCLRDKQSGRVLGYFYADWYPRSSKRGGAWMNPLFTGDPYGASGEEVPNWGVICGNMTPPVGDGPALFTHDEVQTVFHEFGHLLHHLLGRSEVAALAGTSVPWDFVELPSQMMENWCWERESLDRFARHYESDEVIADGLFERLQKTRNFRSASGFVRQLLFGSLDVDMHANPQLWAQGDVDDLFVERFGEYLVDRDVKVYAIAPRFGHLFSSPVGYAGGYYSYKWAEVLDADAFSRFLQEGLFSAEVGGAFRREVLERGNTRPVEESFEAFMGREADPEALLVRAGLA